MLSGKLTHAQVAERLVELIGLVELEDFDAESADPLSWRYRQHQDLLDLLRLLDDDSNLLRMYMVDVEHRNRRKGEEPMVVVWDAAVYVRNADGTHERVWADTAEGGAEGGRTFTLAQARSLAPPAKRR